MICLVFLFESNVILTRYSTVSLFFLSLAPFESNVILTRYSTKICDWILKAWFESNVILTRYSTEYGMSTNTVSV